ncbi:MAG: putative zinc-binding protein [Candidatus Bathyarchaeia archaeon]|jgi:uncharacterized metal-binding protein
MSEKKKSKYIIIPCSGIGKALGTITRRATCIVTEELLPNDTDSICLPLLTIEDEETVRKIRENPCITLDGCVAQCAKKNVEHHYGELKGSIRILDVIKENPKLKPGTVLDIGPDGEKLARKTAEKTVKIIGDKS